MECVSQCLNAVMASSSSGCNNTVKAVVTLKHSNDGGLLRNLLDTCFGKTLVLELVSDELDHGNY